MPPNLAPSGLQKPDFFDLCRRVAVIAIFSLWMGGFTFYAAIVIPTANEVLGSHREVGFITQRVTDWLNVIAIVALLILSGNLLILRRKFSILGKSLPITLGVMIVSQCALFFAHPILDRLIQTESQSIDLHAQFYGWHRFYLLTAAVQWITSILYVCSWIKIESISPPSH